MSRYQLSNLDFNSQARIVNLLDPSAAQEPATKNYVDALLQGLAWKDDVVAASTANINLASPGSTIDGITMASGNRFLAKDQTTATENGIYVWNGAAVPATRALDSNSGTGLVNATVSIDQGTVNSGTTWRQTAVNITLGTTSIAFTAFGSVTPDASTTTKGKIQIATQAIVDAGTDALQAVTPATLASYAGRKLKYATTIGDGSATQYTVTHNLNTQDVLVVVYRTSGAYDVVNTDVENTTVNSCTIRFAAAPSSGAFKVVVLG